MFIIDESHYAYSGVPTQAFERPADLRPIEYTSGSFSDAHQKWSETKKDPLVVFQSVPQFDFYLIEAECLLCCDYKLLEPFLSKGIKIPKLKRWSIELVDYNITFVHIKGKNEHFSRHCLQVKNKKKYLQIINWEPKNTRSK